MSTGRAPSAEQVFIDRLTSTGAGALPLGPGDDAAVLPGGWIVSVDSVVEGVHFDSGTPVAEVADKAVGAALSDLAAMGASAEALFLAVQLPPGADAAGLADALSAAAARFEVPVAGGDTTAAPPGALAVSVTVCGRAASPWTRSGARPGDALCVSGPLGGARHGRHLRPRPRFDLVDALRAAAVPVHAAMDLSDGLGQDLPRLCAASGVGARVDAEALPIHADATGPDPVAAALFDGEDFELLLALPEPPVPDAVSGGDLVVIGRVVPAAEGLVLVREGRAVPWPEGGFAHAF